MKKDKEPKERAYQEILRLTPSADWMSDPETVEKVQALGRIASGKEKGTRGRIICVFHEGKLVAEGSSYKLMKLLDLSDATIRRRARNNSVDDDGRQFKYADEKKC